MMRVDMKHNFIFHMSWAHTFVNNIVYDEKTAAIKEYESGRNLS